MPKSFPLLEKDSLSGYILKYGTFSFLWINSPDLTFSPFHIMQVRTYPRHTFTTSEGDVSFSDLGLTSKQEALFLEQITE